MANYPSKNLTGTTIQSAYPNILQMVSGSVLVNGLGTSSLDFNTYTASYSNTSSISLLSNTSSYSLTSSVANILNNGINDFFEKSNSSIVAFTTTNSQSLQLNQDLLVYVNNNGIVFTSGSSVTMPNPLLAGNNYAVYATYNSNLIATYSPRSGSNPLDGFTIPVGYTSTNSRLIGGFYFAHSGSSPITSILRSRDAGGVNATASITASAGHGLVAGDYIDITDIATTPVFSYNSINSPILSVNGDIITYANSGSTESPIVDSGLQIWKINNNGIINQYSLWDLKFRPVCSDPRGMVLVDNRFWVDIWLTGVNYLTNGNTRKGQRIADGENSTSYPLLSTKMGGTGNAYANCNWVTALEVVAHNEKQLLSYNDYIIAAYGTTEAASFGIDPQYTSRCSTYTSQWGMEQASGMMNIWGSDLNYRWDNNTSITSTYRSRDSSSIATITSSVHGFAIGDIITVSGFTGTPGTTYNRSMVTVQSVPSTTTFTYNCVSGSTPEPLTISSLGTISSGVPVFSYLNLISGTRGRQYIQGPYGLVAGVFGGGWYSGASAGSRISIWDTYVWHNASYLGLRGRCDHLVVP